MSPIVQKALLLKEKFGDFVLGEVPIPKPGKDEVLLKIHASALNPVDWKLSKYDYSIEQFPSIRGSDIAGEIVELGEGVTRFALGDRVFTQGVVGDNRQTGFQQYAIADTQCLAKIPPNLTYDDAATIPVAMTAPYVGLYNEIPYGFGFDTPVRPENRAKYRGVPILILGGSSAVGQFAIQLARLSGFGPIIATASLKHEAALKALGATHVLDRNGAVTQAQIEAITSLPIKNIVDGISSAETQKQGFDILAPGGKQIIFLPLEPFWERFPENATLVAELYQRIPALLESGDIKPHNVEVLSDGLSGIPEGLRRLEEGKVSNTKLVARPQETSFPLSFMYDPDDRYGQPRRGRGLLFDEANDLSSQNQPPRRAQNLLFGGAKDSVEAQEPRGGPTLLFDQAHDFNIENQNFINAQNVYQSQDLQSICAGLLDRVEMSAAHDSVDRGGADSPKCHPKTRRAVQGEIMRWIENGEGIGDGKKILWLTGPAGSGKTAIAGSIAEECQKKGWLAGTFFFSAFSLYPRRRSSESLVATLAYQLSEHPALSGLKGEILRSMWSSPAIFEKNLNDQLECIIVSPLLKLSGNRAAWPRVIIIDGVDECDTIMKNLLLSRAQRTAAMEDDDWENPRARTLKAGLTWGPTGDAPESSDNDAGNSSMKRPIRKDLRGQGKKGVKSTGEVGPVPMQRSYAFGLKPGASEVPLDHQQAVLNVISQAARTDSFPFRIIVFSRPERPIREFFSSEQGLSKKMFLDNKYNPDADIALYLRAKFDEIGRRYRLPSNWVTEDVINLLVREASGQFIYASTAIRFVGDANSERPPLEQLNSILQWRREADIQCKPFAPLDLLYTCIIKTSPDPTLAAKWIATIHFLNNSWEDNDFKDLYIRGILESSAGQMQWLLGGLASLLRLPSFAQGPPRLCFYHKSLLDFLDTPSRSQHAGLYVNETMVKGFLKERYHTILKNQGPQVQQPNEVSLREILVTFAVKWMSYFDRRHLPYCDVDMDWWFTCLCTVPQSAPPNPLAIVESVTTLFHMVHVDAHWAMDPAYMPYNEAHDFHVGTQNLINAKNSNVYQFTGSAAKAPIERLLEHVEMGAAYDSVDRGGINAPKCHPETRKAVQEEIMGWIEQGDGGAGDKRILLLAGPAGAGKTAIAGSIADECQKKGWLAGSFFFSASSLNHRLRSSQSVVATLAYQFTEHPQLAGLKDAILSLISSNPTIFEKNLQAQLGILLLQPLRTLLENRDASLWPKVVIIDGLDECETSAPIHPPTRKPPNLGMGLSTNFGMGLSTYSSQFSLGQIDLLADIQMDHQQTVLMTLAYAAKSEFFPFRIVVVSRPERSIFEFFSKENSLSKKIFLDNKYNPDADIAVYLEAKFDEIRRRYDLALDWISRETIDYLIQEASGQFIYASTVIRFVDSPGAKHPPVEQLNLILKWRQEGPTNSKPFARLDRLYTAIINTSPNPTMAARWVSAMHYLKNDGCEDFFITFLLESSPGQMQWLLGGLASLLQLPSFQDGQSNLHLHHKSLLDFLGTESRSQHVDLFVSRAMTEDFLKGRYHWVLKNRGPLHRGSLLDAFLIAFAVQFGTFLDQRSRDHTDDDVDWWFSTLKRAESATRPSQPSQCSSTTTLELVTRIFHSAHHECEWFICLPACRVWRRGILRHFEVVSWKFSGFSVRKGIRRGYTLRRKTVPIAPR
ncbi:hypothetical protein NMY22_g2297 [Coprinellus aureogranulatus]|nr:hypothetical protein NMY22_g2297 [Coprinellus aureogranulatus]